MKHLTWRSFVVSGVGGAAGAVQINLTTDWLREVKAMKYQGGQNSLNNWVKKLASLCLRRSWRQLGLLVLGLAVASLALTVNGQVQKQARRPRQVTPVPTPKPTPKPSPTPGANYRLRVPELPKPAEKAKPTPTAQPGKPQEPETEAIRISSNLVAVPVSVTDQAGQPVRSLKAEDFQLREEETTQQVQTLGEPGKTPVELALLFDVSGSVHERFDFERQAAARFAREVLKPNDTISVFTIGLRPKLVVPRTKSVEQALAGIGTVTPTKEATAFYDAVVRAAQYLSDNAEPGTRRVLVIISDGEDTLSEDYLLKDAQRELQRSDSLFYAINPSGPGIRLNKISMRGQLGLTTLANETGGMAFLPDKPEDLNQVFHQIAAELQAQYLLGYYSTNEVNDGKFRRITLHVPKYPNLRIRARQGYYAPKN
jgi:Ca-activated chloride channel family protein